MTDVYDHRRRGRRPRRLQRPARVDRMDRAHRRRAHRPRVRDAGPAAAARRARHPGRPLGHGPARAFGTPRHHRTGAPRAPRLVAGPRRAGGRPRTSSHRRCATTRIVLTPGEPPSPHNAGSRSTVSCSTSLRCSTTPGCQAPSRTSTSPCTARRWPASSATATDALRQPGGGDQRDRHASQPRCRLSPAPRPISCPPARQSTSSARAATRSPTRSAGAWSSSSRDWASSANSPRCGARGQAGTSRPGVVRAPLRRHRPEHPDGAVRLTEHRRHGASSVHASSRFRRRSGSRQCRRWRLRGVSSRHHPGTIVCAYTYFPVP